MITMFQSVLSLILLIVAPLSTTPKCFWRATVTTFTDSFSPHHVRGDNTDVISIETHLNGLDVKNLYSEKKENYSAFKHFLLASVDCGSDSESFSVASHLFSAGGGAEVTIYLSPEGIDGYHASPKVLKFVAAVINSTQDECEANYCQLVWLVPFPIYSRNLIAEVEIKTGGGFHGIYSQSFMVHVDGFLAEEDASESVFSELGAVCTRNYLEETIVHSLNTAGMHQLQPLTSAFIFSGGGNTLIYSNNNFEDLIGILVNLPMEETAACDHMSSPLQAFSLPDRILISTSNMIFEVLGSLHNISPINKNSVLQTRIDVCPRKIIIGPHSASISQVIYVLGLKKSEETILRAQLVYGEQLHLEEVGSSQSACQFVTAEVTGVTGCLVVSGTISGIHSSELILLVETTGDMSEAGAYHLLRFSDLNETGEWSFLSNISSLCGTGRISDDLHMKGECLIEERGLNLTSVSSLAFPSSKLFVWGSILIYSPDGGETLFHVQEYPSSPIILFTSSTDAQFAILNDQNEIWYGLAGTTVSLIKLRPSYGWILQDVLYGENAFHWKQTLSLFFDDAQKLRELKIEDNDIGQSRLSSKVIQVSAIIISNQHSVFPQEMPRQCPFKEMHIETTLNQRADRSFKFFFFPPLLTKSALHNEDSLIVYQGIVHKALDFSTLEKFIIYSGARYSPTWKFFQDMEPLESYHDYLYRNRLLQSNIHVPLNGFGIHRNQDNVTFFLL